ncbi:MAG: hypothetical protein ACLTSZ_01855 [Lachnospiraceae bacterium]
MSGKSGCSTWEAGADNATGTIKEITFTPHEEYPGAAADTAEFLAAVQNAVANIRSADGTTSVEWLRAIHNYVCTHIYEEKQEANAHGLPAAPFYMTTGSSMRAMQDVSDSLQPFRFRVCWWGRVYATADGSWKVICGMRCWNGLWYSG